MGSALGEMATVTMTSPSRGRVTTWQPPKSTTDRQTSTAPVRWFERASVLRSLTAAHAHDHISALSHWICSDLSEVAPTPALLG